MDIKYPNYRWFVLFVMIIATIGQGMVLIAPSPMIQSIYVSIFGAPNHADNAGAFAGQISLLLMVSFTLFVVIGGIAGGAISDRIGLPKTFLVSLILMVIGSLLFIVAGNSIAMLLIARILGGLGAGPVIAVQTKLAAEWFSQKERFMVLGLGSAALSVGIAIGLNAGQAVYMGTGAQEVFYLHNIKSGVIDSANKIFDPSSVNPALFMENRLVRVIEGGNWNFSVGIMGIVCLVAVVLSLIWMKGPRPPANVENVAGADHAGENLFKLAVRSPAFYAGVLAFFCASWTQQAVNDLTPNYLGDTFIGLGWGAANGGAVLGFFSIAFMIGSLASSVLLMTIFKGRVRVLNPIAFFVGAAAVAAFLLPQFINTDPSHPGMPPQFLIFLMVVAGFFIGFPMPSTQTFISVNYPQSIAGRLGGLTVGLGILGGTIGVAVGSVALAATGNYKVSVMIIAVICVIGAFGSMAIKRPKAFSQEK